MTIIFTKPFRVGEYIEMVGVNGQVTNIELFSTTLLHSDKSRVVIPNRKIVGEILHNCGNIRQLNLTVGIAYNSDVKSALATIHAILSANARVLKDPKPVVGIEALAASAITIGISFYGWLFRFWLRAIDGIRCRIDSLRHGQGRR